MTWYKVLDKWGQSCHKGNAKYSLPKDGPGDWMSPVEGELWMCRNGYHLVDEEHLVEWLTVDGVVYIAEPGIETRGPGFGGKLCCRTVRLLKRIGETSEKMLQLLACDYAEHVLHIYEKVYPWDLRVRNCIETIRRLIHGEVTQEEFDAAWDGAGDAIYAAWADKNATRDVIEGWNIESAAIAARAAWGLYECDRAPRVALNVAHDARKATRAISRKTWYVEEEWQTKKLFEYLGGGI